MIKHLFTLPADLLPPSDYDSICEFENVSVYFEPSGRRLIHTVKRAVSIRHCDLVHIVFKLKTPCVVLHAVYTPYLEAESDPRMKLLPVNNNNAFSYGHLLGSRKNYLYLTCFGDLKSAINDKEIDPIHAFWCSAFTNIDGFLSIFESASFVDVYWLVEAVQSNIGWISTHHMRWSE